MISGFPFSVLSLILPLFLAGQIFFHPPREALLGKIVVVTRVVMCLIRNSIVQCFDPQPQTTTSTRVIIVHTFTKDFQPRKVHLKIYSKANYNKTSLERTLLHSRNPPFIMTDRHKDGRADKSVYMLLAFSSS